ncbi:MAG TPA: hypothetical protein VFY29_03675 [Terriglobia bacterium]|nr:hypothetical protein [Terriglobia bacterium]
MKTRALAVAIAVLAISQTSAFSQWLNVKLPGVPRNADGTVNLQASPPRAADGKVDLSGVWRAANGRFIGDLARAGGVQAPLLPAAAALYNERKASNGLDRPSGKCLPKSVPDGMILPPYPIKIVQTPAVTLMLYEIFVAYRQIHTDGRALPERRDPNWYGYSVGKWDGDTFVVETVGITERTWLDDSGYPHSDDMKVTERIRRSDFGHMTDEFTFDDPKTYTRPWTITVPFELVPDTELLEYVCENEKDLAHMPAK